MPGSTPMSGPPTSAPPTSAPPTSDGGPWSAEAAPTARIQPAPQQPYPGQPYPGQPYAAPPPQQYPPVGYPAPVSAQPASPYPASPGPVSGGPVSANPFAPPALPPYGTTDPLTPGPARITPSPPRNRSGLLIGLAIGLAVALLLGVGGFFLGRGTASPTAAPTASPAASPSASLHPYEASQLAINKTKLDGEFTALAQPWLAVLGGCATDTDTGGPKLPKDESKHVFCRYGSVSVHFSLFKSPTDRDNGRKFRQQLNSESDGLAPGLAAPGRKPGGVTKTQGNYVEYAFKEQDGRAICGIWWDHEDSQAVLLLESLCQEGLGGSWAPLRDLWQRYS
jgi:hypothetical protein